ncbi:ABC transporter permease subunit [candidate division NPL-UPA2 bacterium]|nr:ABC transporter permease subunit [candidate division NPL-UPA2 bacterium]
MPIIGSVGRRSLGVRLLNICIHFLLIAGGITMVYPFLIMLTGSVKCERDFKYLNIIPRYLIDETILFQKHIRTKYNARLDLAQEALRKRLISFEKLQPPGDFPPRRVEDWEAFLESRPPTMDHFFFGLGAVSELGVEPAMQRAIKEWLQEQYENDLKRLNEELGTNMLSWEEVRFVPEDFTKRRHLGDYRGILARFQEFKENYSPELYRYYFSLDGAFMAKLGRRYGWDLEALNQALKTDFQQWGDVHLSRRKPPGPLGALWEEFVREDLNLQFIRLDEEALPVWQEFLRSKYHEDIYFLNKVYETAYSNFDEIPLVEEVPTRGILLVDWAEFVESEAPAGALSIRSAEFYYRDFLKGRYRTLEELNRAHGTNYRSFETVNIPTLEWEWTLFQRNKRALRWEFLTRNFIVVLNMLLFEGRAIWNTFVYCSLAILAALIVNPMAAYALSRYKPPSTYKILLFLMLTMSFPPMVVGIPQFLLIRHLGLLNTFAALILPTMASGFSIFLLKGFFDSLPQELFECATLDGASEWTMFWQIAMALSKPILAVIALGAFTVAYGNFMLAFIVCQDPRMWTLMVHLYMLQQRASQPVVFASLIIAAIPTFLIFLFCQNIILRGIVVPTEK